MYFWRQIKQERLSHRQSQKSEDNRQGNFSKREEWVGLWNFRSVLSLSKFPSRLSTHITYDCQTNPLHPEKTTHEMRTWSFLKLLNRRIGQQWQNVTSEIRLQEACDFCHLYLWLVLLVWVFTRWRCELLCWRGQWGRKRKRAVTGPSPANCLWGHNLPQPASEPGSAASPRQAFRWDHNLGCYLDFSFVQDPETRDRDNKCCFKPLSFWIICYITVDHEYRPVCCWLLKRKQCTAGILQSWHLQRTTMRTYYICPTN